MKLPTKKELINVIKRANLVPVTFSEFAYGARKTEVYSISGSCVYINLGKDLNFCFDFGRYGQTGIGCKDTTLYCSIGTAYNYLSNYLDCKLSEADIYTLIS